MRAKRQLLVAATIAISVVAPLFAAADEYRASDVEDAIARLYSENQEERVSGAFKISEMGGAGKAAVPKLVEMLETDPIQSVRGQVAQALGKMGTTASSAVPALIAFLQSKDGGYERTYAATALGDIGALPEKTIPVLVNAVENDSEPVVQQLAARALGDFKGQATGAIPVLIKAIKNGNKDLRDAACDALTSIPASAKEVPALSELLDDQITSSRIAAAKSLAGAGADAAPALQTLIKMLSDSDANVRNAAAAGLAGIGKDAKAALPALKLALKNPETQSAAQDAIASIKGTK